MIASVQAENYGPGEKSPTSVPVGMKYIYAQPSEKCDMNTLQGIKFINPTSVPYTLRGSREDQDERFLIVVLSSQNSAESSSEEVHRGYLEPITLTATMMGTAISMAMMKKHTTRSAAFL